MSAPPLEEQPGRPSKRVRFAEAAGVGSRDAPQPLMPGRQWQAQAGCDDSDDDDDGGGGSPGGVGRLSARAGACISAGDVAAAEAARKRRVLRGMTAAEDASVLEELEGAEEEYEEPEELFTSDGIPIEPFHLRQERAEGFFDAAGSYVAYRLEDEGDAWLDSLGDGPVVLEPGLAAALEARQAADEAGQAGPGDRWAAGQPLDEDDAAIYKQRIVQLLQPGESVLHALRRLAGGVARGGAHQPATDSTAQRQRRRRQAQQQQQQQQVQAQGQQPPEQQQQQQQQSSSSSEEQLQLQAQAAPDAAPAATAAAPATPPATIAAAAAAGGSSTRAATPQHPPCRSSGGGSGSGSGRRASSSSHSAASGVPPENRHAFERLTEYADTLLTNGDVNIYSMTREVMARQLAALAGLDVMLGQAAGRQHDSSGSGGNGGGKSAAVAARGDSPAAAPAAEPPAAAPAASDGVDDMFAEDEGCGGNAAAASEAAAPPPADDTAAPPGDTAATTSAGAPGAAAAPSPAAASFMDGFVLDEASGCYYNAAAGLYFEPGRCLFGDAASGLWYAYHADSGTYSLVEPAG